MEAKIKLLSDNKMTAREILVEYGSVIAFFILLLFNILVTPNFLSVNTLLLIIKQATSLLFVSVGMTLVISAGGIDNSP